MAKKSNKRQSTFSGFWHRSFLGLIGLGFTGIIVFGVFLFFVIVTLPNIDQLKDVRLQVPLRVYSADNKLIGEFGEKRRAPIALNQVPPLLIVAILDTEDQRFYEHSGVDFISLMRAGKVLLATGEKLEGASTITMQVARNFFLTRQKTYLRKLREIFLAMKIDKELSKNKILELYLNKIYFGQRAYGVAAAAQVYYGKSLNELTLPEIAMIAGLPRAPSFDNPITNPERAIKRRNHVLERMFSKGDIDAKTYQQAINAPVTASYHEQQSTIYAPFISEMARNEMQAKFGDNIYDNGYKVYTTVDSRLQALANNSLRDGIIAYSKRHGYLGPENNWGTPPTNLQNWREKLEQIATYNYLRPAAVLQVNDKSIVALLANGNQITINWPDLIWARKQINDTYLGPAPTSANDIAKVGDIIRVQYQNNRWQFEQLPKINGALIALNPNNGAILALNGGFSFLKNNFNNVIQAARQPGSSFKPFIYSAALEKGFTLASVINDAPIVISSTGEDSLWRPQNVNRKFYGPTRLRIGLIKSRNLVSIRLLQAIGIPYALDYLQRFGFDSKNFPATLSLALGTANISPESLATGYAVFANGGYQVKPYVINKIVDEDGKTVFQAQPETVPNANNYLATGNPNAPRVITPQNAYLLTDVMKDVIRQGTGQAALKLNRTDLAGKTGTTNNQIDAWFSGFNCDLVATVWIGYDQPKSIHEYGAQAALPIWMNFIANALKGQPNHSLPEPSGIVTARIDPISGLLAYPGQQNAIFELFRSGNVPTQRAAAQNIATPAQQNNGDQSNSENYNNAELF